MQLYLIWPSILLSKVILTTGWIVMKSRPVEKSVRRKRQRSSFSLDFISFCLLLPARAECCYPVRQTSAPPAAAEHRELPERKKSQTGINIKAGWMDGWMDVRHSTHIVHLSVETNSIIQFI